MNELEKVLEEHHDDPKEVKRQKIKEVLKKELQQIREKPEDNYKENPRRKEIIRKRIRNGVIVIFSLAAVAALAKGIILLKKAHDDYINEVFDENGRARRITVKVEDSYLKGSIIYNVENGEAVKRYRTPHVYFFINKETGEVIKHLYFTENNYWLLFELDTEEMVSRQVVPDLGDPPYSNRYYYEQLRDEYDWVPLTDAPMYIENFKLKEAYTKEEIDAIEPEFVKGYKLIEEAKASNSK